MSAGDMMSILNSFQGIAYYLPLGSMKLGSCRERAEYKHLDASSKLRSETKREQMHVTCRMGQMEIRVQ